MAVFFSLALRGSQTRVSNISLMALIGESIYEYVQRVLGANPAPVVVDTVAPPQFLCPRLERKRISGNEASNILHWSYSKSS